MSAHQRSEAIRAISKIDGATSIADGMTKLSMNEPSGGDS